ncbi:MAG: glycosyltransferase family 2 protein, partial [Pseudomonadota bacterium]|nr:glycosyltransferase family 2 protein [Pseudomonadota bacterium]
TPSEMEMVSQVQPGPALACAPVKAPLLEPEPAQPRLVLVGLSVVRNEGDVIESFVRHNLRFLDALLIVDNGSVDGTREILVQLQREGLSVVVQDDPLFGHFQSRRMSQLCRQACLVFSPDYLFALDADEFIMAPTRAALEEELGHLPSGHHGVLAWSTYVYQPVQDGQYPASTLARMIFRRLQETPGYYKVVVSGAIDPETVEIAEGNHSVSQTDKTSLSHTLLSGVRLAHFPVRSSRQLSCKILSGWLANLSKNPDIAKTSEAWHWHALYDRLKQNPCLTEDELAVISLNYAQSTGYTRVDDTVIVADPFAVGFVHQYDHLYVDSLPSVLTNMMEQLVLGQTSSMVFPEYQDLMRRLNLDTVLHIGQDEAAWVNQLRQIGFNRVSYLDAHFLTDRPTEFSFCLSENIALEESFDCLICDAGEGEFDLSQWRDTLKNLLPCISKCILFYSVKEPSTTFQVWTDIGWYLHPFYTRIVRFLKSDALPVRYAWVLVPTVS